jgi:hypothetical protein
VWHLCFVFIKGDASGWWELIVVADLLHRVEDSPNSCTRLLCPCSQLVSLAGPNHHHALEGNPLTSACCPVAIVSHNPPVQHEVCRHGL